MCHYPSERHDVTNPCQNRQSVQVTSPKSRSDALTPARCQCLRAVCLRNMVRAIRFLTSWTWRVPSSRGQGSVAVFSCKLGEILIEPFICRSRISGNLVIRNVIVVEWRRTTVYSSLRKLRRHKKVEEEIEAEIKKNMYFTMRRILEKAYLVSSLYWRSA